VEIIRIGTRVPAVLPFRITKKLGRRLRRYKPLYIITHFNHPNEITREAEKACNILADYGIPLLNQTVLLKGINDKPEICKELFQKLLTIRVKPYYLFHCMDVNFCGTTNHFRTKVSVGLEIWKKLQGYTSGLALPIYVLATVKGKIPIVPNYIVKHEKKVFILKNYRGDVVKYEDAP
jgi:lysine 2,3-aminomutase